LNLGILRCAQNDSYLKIIEKSINELGNIFRIQTISG
jgi:hypothetical protein